MQLVDFVCTVTLAFVLFVPFVPYAVSLSIVASTALAIGVLLLVGGMAFAMPLGSALSTLLTISAASWFNVALVYALTSSTDSGNLVALMSSWLLLLSSAATLMRVNRPTLMQPQTY